VANTSKRKRKGKAQKTGRESDPGLVILNERMASGNFQRYRIINYSVIGLAVLIYGVFLLTTDDEIVTIRPGLKAVAEIGSLLCFFFIGCGLLNMYRLVRYSGILVTEGWLKRWYMLHVFISSLLLAVPIFTVAYRFGAVDAISALINAYWQGVSKWAADSISSVVTVVLSGVAGNFAYDMLKRLVLRKIRR